MRLSSTTTLRTYRHLRLAIVGAAVAVLLVAVIVTVTEGPVTSLSELYYTSGRTVFTGALFALALALVALSGHSLEQVLLDIAAPFALLIAIVPTPDKAGDLSPTPGPCPADAVACSAADASLRTGVIAVTVMGVLGAVTAAVVAILRRRPGAPVAVPRGVWAPALVVVLVSIGVVVWLALAPRALLALGHFVATGVFFGIMSAVSVVSAITARHRWRALYVVVAVGMVAALVYLVIVFFVQSAGAGRGQPWVLGGEVALVVFFAVFWLAQTVQKWDELDPAVRG